MARIVESFENTPSEMLRGIAIMVLAAGVIPLLDVCGKMLVTDHDISPGEVALSRQFLQTVMILPVILATEGVVGLRTTRPGLNMLRGLLLSVAAVAFFGALRFMPLADAVAVFMVEPLIVTVLSAVFLKETIGFRRIAAVCVGFVGAIIIIRPSYAVFGAASLLPLFTALLVAAYFILSRKVSRGTSPSAMMVHAGAAGTVALVIAMAIGHPLGMEELRFTWPDSGATWVLILLAGGIGTLGHLFFVMAYRLAPASVLAPFGYLEIVSAIGFGYLFFGDLPDMLKFVGIAIIVGSGLFVYLRERRARLSLDRATVAPPN
ncbi:DMT family transporter [Jiella marina]|uniref:DMT family transporter n=1 Tax=Jiella sp. LLJ827 TaxID=2917712 RepID=UPI002101D330|nr:DMT family transporter [Jiella sp. LLJ827]MCQ0987327.1 DMT family transporter [Jiella sp. LLJ827]